MEAHTSPIEGKVIVITGASSGLGETATRELTRLGAKVVFGARRVENLQKLAEELNLPQKAAVKVDVSKQSDVENLIKTALDLYGHIDVLINNAGVFYPGPLELGDVQNWEKMIDTNIKGALYGINAIIPHFKERKSGQIVNVSSIVGHQVMPGGVVYSLTKFAIRALSEGLRQELKPYNVRVLNVSPGPTESEGLRVVASQAPAGSGDFSMVPTKAYSDALIYAIGQPEQVDVNEIIFRPTN